MMKKFLSVLLAVMMMFSIVPATSIQAAAATSLSVNTVNEAIINIAGGSADFEFSPTVDGAYVIYSTSNADTVVTLYDDEGTKLASDEDSGDAYNFRLEYDFKAGEIYHFEIQYNSSSSAETGRIPFAFGEVYKVIYKSDKDASLPETQTKDFGAEIELSNNTPSCEGYVFVGWSTTPNSSTVSYLPKDKFSENKNTNLYAIWALDVNKDVFSGAELTVNTSFDAVIEHADGCEYFKFTAPEYGNYGVWSTTNVNIDLVIYNEIGMEINAFSGNPNFQVLFELNKDQTVYFEVKYSDESRIGTIPFVVGNIYKITYVVNGGTITPETQMKIYDYPTGFATPTRVGYMFKGWATQPDSTDVVYAADAVYTDNADITLYALWEKADVLDLNSLKDVEITVAGDSKFYSYTPTEDGMYVIYSNSAVDTEVVMYNASGIEIARKDDIEKETLVDKRFEKDFRLQYYMFAGKTYYFEVNFKEATRVGTIPVTFGETFTVSFDTTGGTTAPSPQIKDYGATLILHEDAPTRVGYTFLGWATSEGSTDVVYTAGGDYSANESVTLYAVWEQGSDLTANGEYEAVINNAGESKYFIFTPSESGKYVIYSTGDEDTLISLYDYEGTLLDSSDDAGDGFNMKLSYEMTAREKYYFEIKYYDSEKTGTIPFTFGKVYTVSYKTDGVDGVFATQEKEYGIDLVLDCELPTKEGYTFVGWSTSATSSTVAYAVGDTYTNEANVTLYAVWAINTYTVTYDANGGENAPAGQVKTYGEDLTLSADVPTREGYTFKGWSTSADGEVEYAPGGVYSNEETVTLYAVWEIKTYTVTYDANGGENAPEGQVKTYGVDLTLSTEIPTRFGYTFLGWSTDATATAPEYLAGDVFTTNADTILYAVWKQEDILTVNSTNNAVIENAGESKLYAFIPAESGKYVIYSTTESDVYVYLYNSANELIEGNDDAGERYNIKLSYDLVAGEKYYFEIKYYDATETGTIPFTFGKVYTVSYKAETYDGVFATQEKEYGIDLVLDCELPTKEGYTLVGWSTSATSSTVAYAVGDTYTNEANVTLYAVWEINTYTVTYDANGGENAPAGQVKTHFEDLTLSTDLPTRDGYTFKGWATSANGTVEYAPGATYTVEEAVTLYAVWEINTYTVTYDANGGENAPAGMSADYGTTVTVSDVIPVREGHTFLGWATTANATVATFVAGDSFTLEADTTLYAVWKINTYAVTYDANGGENAPAAQVKTYGIDLTLSAKEPTREGYIFVGWATNANATTVAYVSGSKYTENKEITLYAVWVATEYTITYNANGGTGAPASKVKAYDEAISISGLEPTRPGYAFLGWATTPDATTATYSPWDIFTENEDTVLYAVWEKDTVISANTSNNAVISEGGQSKYFSFTPSASGKYVIYSTSDADTRVYLYNTAGQQIANNDEAGEDRNFRLEYDMVAGTTYRFEVKYNDDKTTGTIPFTFGKVYTVSYNVNGGSTVVYPQTKDYGATLTLSNTVPTREGYSFLGWATSANAKTPVYYAGGSFTANADTVLYAVWGKNGLEKRADNKWYYVEEGQIVTSKTGLVKHTNGVWYYVENGEIDWAHKGLVKHTNGVWYYVEGGQIKWSKTGLVKHTNGSWYYVEKGQIKWSKTGLVKHTNNVWYYVQGGQIKWSKTGLVKHTDGHLYYVKGGQINWSYTGNATYNGKTYKVVKGKV